MFWCLEKAQLWSALHLYARFMTQCGPSQSSIRELDRDEDLISELTLHAFQKVQDGKYGGTAPFSHWVTVVFWNFTRTRQAELTKEKKAFANWREGEAPMDDNGNARPEEGCIYENEIPLASDEDTRQHFAKPFDDVVTNPSDRAYARLLVYGLDQKEAAKRIGESVVTSRKREKRLRIALEELGLARTAGTQVASA